MPYGIGLKDERPTSNIERPTSNEKTNIQYQTFNTYFCFFSAILKLVTKTLIHSFVSCKISLSSSGFLMSGTRRISFNHLWLSVISFIEILALVFVFHSAFDVGRSMFDVHLLNLTLNPVFGVVARSAKPQTLLAPLNFAKQTHRRLDSTGEPLNPGYYGRLYLEYF